jgi:hypothetical protein
MISLAAAIGQSAIKGQGESSGTPIPALTAGNEDAMHRIVTGDEQPGMQQRSHQHTSQCHGHTARTREDGISKGDQPEKQDQAREP